VKSSGEPESREGLIRHLEELTGRSFRTRADIHAYVEERARRNGRDLPSVRRWRKAKQVTLIGLLAFGVLQYHFLDVMLEILQMRTSTYFVPASARMIRS
jgi:hypothetical protein